MRNKTVSRWRSQFEEMAFRKLSNYCLVDKLYGTNSRKTAFISAHSQRCVDVVRDMYSDVDNSSQIFELKTKLWKSRQGDRDVKTYYNEMVTL